jgi:dTMP kinase
MSGCFITFEGNEGSGKSTQIPLLAERLRSQGRVVLTLREPGGTPIGEELRHTLKHSHSNHAMTPEAELLLMSASRAQLVREVIRPALDRGEIVVCDRFYDSTTAYQGYGRKLNLEMVQTITAFAVGPTRPNLTFLLLVPQEVSERRRAARQLQLPQVRDRMEEAERDFFLRVGEGYEAIAKAEPGRVHQIQATGSAEEVHSRIWAAVESWLKQPLP